MMKCVYSVGCAGILNHYPILPLFVTRVNNTSLTCIFISYALYLTFMFYVSATSILSTQEQ